MTQVRPAAGAPPRFVMCARRQAVVSQGPVSEAGEPARVRPQIPLHGADTAHSQEPRTLGSISRRPAQRSPVFMNPDSHLPGSGMPLAPLWSWHAPWTSVHLHRLFASTFDLFPEPRAI